MQWAPLHSLDEEETEEDGGSPTVPTRLPHPASVRMLLATSALVLAVVAVVALAGVSINVLWQRPAGPSWRIKDEISDAELESPTVIEGGKAAKASFQGFLSVWRELYQTNSGTVPELECSSLPKAFQDVRAKLVLSAGGAANGGIVTEGIAYGILVEGVLAAAGSATSMRLGLELMKAWLGMTYGPAASFGAPAKPLGGGDGHNPQSATDVNVPPYGVSAIRPQGPGARGPAGVPWWKYPINACSWGLCRGSATDADEDAVFGMIHLAAALGHPEDFVDTVMRSVIAVVSADLGFPDLYRTLPDGTKVFVPKGGSTWGGLLPPYGLFKGTFNRGCINPSYLAPAHYRLFRDFARDHWKASFDEYLPPHLDGTKSSLAELTEALDGAVIASYNLLYRTSCDSGVVSNWAGAHADCPDSHALNCPGVPWATTPHAPPGKTCAGSGTKPGSWGKDASRSPWRIAMDYVLYPAESARVRMYDTSGNLDPSIDFNAKAYLNRLAKQYVEKAKCNGGSPGDCDLKATQGRTDADKLAPAFVADLGAAGLTCNNVPRFPDPAWWAAEMAHPTFTGFVAPFGPLSAAESASWLDTLANICDFSEMSSFDDVDTSHGAADLCSKTYFQASQQVVSSLITSGSLKAGADRLTGVTPRPVLQN